MLHESRPEKEIRGRIRRCPTCARFPVCREGGRTARPENRERGGLSVASSTWQLLPTVPGQLGYASTARRLRIRKQEDAWAVTGVGLLPYCDFFLTATGPRKIFELTGLQIIEISIGHLKIGEMKKNEENQLSKDQARYII